MNESDRYLRLAIQQRDQGNAGEAIRSLQRSLSQDPNNAEAHAWLAICCYDEYIDRRRPELLRQATASAKNSIVLNAEDPMPHYVMGLLSMLRGELGATSAKNHFQNALNLDPGNPILISAMANWHVDYGKRKTAIQLFERALAVEPGNYDTLCSVGEYYIEHGQLKKAEKYAVAALSSAPESNRAHLLMGNVKFRLGKIDEAREHVGFCMNHNPSDYNSLFLMCAIETHGNFILRYVFIMMTILNANSKNYIYLLPLVSLICMAISFLPKEIMGISVNVVYIALLMFMIYLIYMPFILMRKVKKKYSGNTTLKDDF